MSISQSNPPVPSRPLVIASSQAHKTTLIILHGRGSTAEKFAEPLLQHVVSAIDGKTIENRETSASSKTFQQHLPNTKFVFPTAPLRRAVVFKRSLTHQWFDNWSLTQPELKQHLQVPGLRETSVFLHVLLREEIKTIGAENVVLMGLSQGCAVSTIAALLWQGEPFGALIGMCGYLPFRKSMQDYIEESDDRDSDSFVGSEADGDDMFERDGEDRDERSRYGKAVDWLREELRSGEELEVLSSASPSLQSIPVFMGHGKDDERVPHTFGKLAADFLDSINVDVTWKEYEGLGHWYSEDMLRDVIEFLKEKVKG
ncbi:similar to phospholipase/carboxylesterase family protein [Plenodomus lingam JN3]|uniref:Similar to phospholipase/carboxylesterase family protein n=1 Tax=Leptosphaeria maculans (strain JN3 / isolate v23.1.3 / race Av1-4-5-6-7-8) TaxID=985895 RepID=E4ZYI8_LEPMJ|nr:similar to phospholipase/carboxylesterase family protein [Plenodomus lingam JN3]CBX96514.1 similar to phospholipase/carboxylesterase family protein [Plenodomus lingam JN3]